MEYTVIILLAVVFFAFLAVRPRLDSDEKEYLEWNDEAKDRVTALIASGKKIEAIKIVRQATGKGLKEAKNIVESIAANTSPSLSYPYNRAVKPFDDEAKAKIRHLIASGKKIEAIKELREVTGLGLKEAKNLVDAAEKGKGDLAL